MRYLTLLALAIAGVSLTSLSIAQTTPQSYQRTVSQFEIAAGQNYRTCQWVLAYHHYEWSYVASGPITSTLSWPKSPNETHTSSDTDEINGKFNTAIDSYWCWDLKNYGDVAVSVFWQLQTDKN